MSVKNLFLRSLAMMALGTATLFAPVSQAQERQYATLEVAQPTDTPGKVEVLEFFAYSCPHCKTMEPMIEKWSKSLPEDVVLRRVPVAFNASMSDLQKLYYSLESMGRMDLHPAVFKAIHDERKRIYDAKAMTDWVVDQGVERKAFEDVFTSFGVQTKVNRANELAKSYAIEGTPSLAVAGKYVTSPTMTGSYEATITEAQKLVEMARK